MLSQLSARKAAKKICNGNITSRELVTDCLERIKQTDDKIGAWAFLDSELALTLADAADVMHQKGAPCGPLHGVPVGVKDIYDTSNMPTAWGTKCHSDRRPNTDSAVVDKLHEAGAIVLGKTVTTELAFAMRGPTRNPYNDKHTTGGSSAGSAASVATDHVPLAIGSQTNGSVIRPASFCGTYGFKPTRGIISRRGCLQTSQTLDQVGVMGRSLKDIALLVDVLAGHDPVDPATYARAKPNMLKGARAKVPVEPIFAWFDLPYQNKLTPAMQEGMEEILSLLGDRVERISAPNSFTDVIREHQIIHEYEFLENLGNDPTTSPEHIHETLAPKRKSAERISEKTYREALKMVSAANNYFTEFFCDYDAIITPSALGEAPLLEEGSGDPICSTIWTLAGLPCLSLPMLSSENYLPMGVQLVGFTEQDDRLLRTASWLEKQLA
ncbi:MAG: amidase [bacterium]|nr:amidase [bacterium]